MQYIDGVKILPKLPVHIQTHRKSFEMNQQVNELVLRAGSGFAWSEVEQPNKVFTPSTTEERNPISNLAPLPDIQQEAIRNDQNVVTAGM